MDAHGYGEEYASRYRSLARFHNERVPLIVLVAGCGALGLSAVAVRLAQRLNVTRLLQTDTVLAVARAAGEDSSRDGDDDDDVIDNDDDDDVAQPADEWRADCATVRAAAEVEVRAAVEHGRTMVMSGAHVDMEMFAGLLAGAPGGAVVVPCLLSPPAGGLPAWAPPASPARRRPSAEGVRRRQAELERQAAAAERAGLPAVCRAEADPLQIDNTVDLVHAQVLARIRERVGD